MVTLTPLSDLGRLPFTMSLPVQVWPGNVLARLEPRIVTQEPASMPGWKLAPFTTAVIVGGPGCASFTTKESRYPVGPFELETGKVPDSHK